MSFKCYNYICIMDSIYWLLMTYRVLIKKYVVLENVKFLDWYLCQNLPIIRA